MNLVYHRRFGEIVQCTCMGRKQTGITDKGDTWVISFCNLFSNSAQIMACPLIFFTQKVKKPGPKKRDLFLNALVELNLDLTLSAK